MIPHPRLKMCPDQTFEAKRIDGFCCEPDKIKSLNFGPFNGKGQLVIDNFLELYSFNSLKDQYVKFSSCLTTTRI